MPVGVILIGVWIGDDDGCCCVEVGMVDTSSTANAIRVPCYNTISPSSNDDHSVSIIIRIAVVVVIPNGDCSSTQEDNRDTGSMIRRSESVMMMMVVVVAV